MLDQCGPTTGMQATYGLRIELLRLASFLNIVCCVYVTVGNFC